MTSTAENGAFANKFMQRTIREIEQPLKPFIIIFTALSVGTVMAAVIIPIVQHRSQEILMPLFLGSCWWILFALIRRSVRQRERPEWRVDEEGLTRFSASGEEDKIIQWSEVERIALTNSGLRLFWKPWGEENFTKRPLSLFLSTDDASFIQSEWTGTGQSYSGEKENRLPP